jgi:tetratricopeptide (TPR) repeat protein
MDNPSHADVFVSYHSSDAAAAQAFASMLRAHALHVQCDTLKDEAIDDASRTPVALRTKVFVAWISMEYCNHAALQREFMQVFAASTVHTPRERILLIDSLNTHDAALPSTLRAGCKVLRPNQLSEFTQHLASHTKRLAGVICKESAPPELHRDFIGRLGHLWHLNEALGIAPAPLRCVQLVGDPGAGKTWLADAYAQLFAAAYPAGVFRVDAGWFEGASPQQLRVMRTLAWREVATKLGIDCDSLDAETIDLRVQECLEQRGRPYIWIIDHVPARQNSEDLRTWFAPSTHGATILISRSDEYASLGAQITVAGLDEDEARTLLHRHKPMATAQEAAAGRQLIQQLGHHALALHFAANRLARSTYDRMLLQLAAPAREAAQLADSLAPTLEHPQLVGIAVSLQRSILRLSPQARQALRLASVLAAAAPVPFALLTTALAQHVRSASTHTTVSQTQLAVDELFCFALAQRVDHDRLIVTPLVREGVLGCESPADLDGARDLLVAILAGELPQALAPNGSNHYWSWIPHVLHITRTAKPSSQLLEVSSWLARFDMLGALFTGNRRAVALLEQGDLSNAQQLLDMELAARRSGLGDNHPQTVTPVNNLAVALSLRGDFARARTLFEEAIEVRRKSLGDNHSGLLTPLNNLGVVLWHEGEHAKARALFEKVVELRRELLGDRHPETLVSMRNLAVALRHDGEYVAAQSLLEHVVEVRRAALGTQHIDTYTAMASLAETLREHSEAILARISETFSLDTSSLLSHEAGVRIARA